MLKIVKEITVDVAKKNIFQTIVAKQNDNNSRFLKVTLCNEGVKIDIQSSATATINARRADNTSKIYVGTINQDGTVTVPITKWMLELDDVVHCSVSIIGTEGEKLTSTTFAIEPEAAECFDENVSENENYDILSQLIANFPTVDSELSEDSENPVQNRTVAKAIENSKPMLITFNNSDFDNSDLQQFPIGISFGITTNRIILIVTFDVSRLNFTIPEGSDVTIHKILIEGEKFDFSLLDEYIKLMETFSSDYGQCWITEGDQYMYAHEYSFGTVDNANTAFAELTELGLNGFQLLINNYNQITAKEV